MGNSAIAARSPGVGGRLFRSWNRSSVLRWRASSIWQVRSGMPLSVRLASTIGTYEISVAKRGGDGTTQTVTMTLADQAAITGHDGQVTSGGKPGRPKRQTFTAAYKARILAAFDALPEGSPERGALLRKERLYHSHLEDWRRQQAAGSLKTGGKKKKEKQDSEPAELARLRRRTRS